MMVVRDAVVSRVLLQHDAHAAARTDALTGLANRRGFEETLAAMPQDRPAALILIDLDDFKDVNDTFGHAAGDTVLAEVACRLRQPLLDNETAFRLGGDEFAIVTTPDRVEAVAETIVAACRVPIFHDGALMRIGASAGVAIGTGDRLRQPADYALYAAKREGRGCWRRAPAVRLAA